MEGDGGGEDGGAGETLAAALRKPARNKGVKDQWIVGATNDKGHVNYRCKWCAKPYDWKTFNATRAARHSVLCLVTPVDIKNLISQSSQPQN